MPDDPRHSAPMSARRQEVLSPEEREQLELSDLLSRVLDKGVVIAGSVLLSVADIDLVRLQLSLVLTSVESDLRRERAREARIAGSAGSADADARLLPDERA